MNILVISNLYPDPQRPIYGIFVQYQVNQLRQMGHDVIVISPHPYVPNLSVIPSKYKKIDHNVPKMSSSCTLYPRTISIPVDFTKPFTAIISRLLIKNWAAQAIGDDFRPDIINAHVALPNGFTSIPLAKKYDCPLVTTVHGADLNRYSKNWLNKKLIIHTLKNSDKIVVNSEPMVNNAVNIGIKKDQIIKIPNGIPIDKINSARNERKPLEISDQKRTIISVGHLIKSKGHRYVIKALSELDESVEYIIIGDGNRQSDLKHLVNQLDIEKQVKFVGEVSNYEVFKYLWHSDIFILPSYREGFGISYLEAMACNTPVIGCKNQGPSEFISHNHDGFLIPPHNTEEIVEILELLLSDVEKRKEMGNNAREKAKSYTWENYAKNLINIFKNC